MIAHCSYVAHIGCNSNVAVLMSWQTCSNGENVTIQAYYDCVFAHGVQKPSSALISTCICEDSHSWLRLSRSLHSSALTIHLSISKWW